MLLQVEIHQEKVYIKRKGKGEVVFTSKFLPTKMSML